MAGCQVLLTLPELDSAGYAQVVAVEPCPAIASGPGRVVLGTFHHSAGDVYDVGLSDGSQLGVTARHPLWSVDRGEWVSVGDLGPGETLETLDGPVQFESATPRAEAAPVFNLEVDADHAYRVGEHGVLVHNESAPPSPCGSPANDECDGLPKVQFSLSGNHSDVAKHIQDAIAAGKPKKLRYDADKANRKARRDIPCPAGRCPSGQSCDEYPFASTHQGGAGASWRCVPPGTNSSQGGVLGNFYKTLKDGDWFCVEVIP